MLNNSNRELIEDKLKQQGIILSEREIDCVIPWLAGNSIKFIAKLLDLSPRTVEWHIDKIRHKFQARNRKELLFILIIGK